MKIFRGLTALVLSALFCSAAQADDYKLTFTATDFQIYTGAIAPSPFSSLSGSFILSVPTLGAAPTAIEAVDLTIGNFSYTSSNVVLQNSNQVFTIGGSASGASGVKLGTSDFWIIVDRNGTSEDFVYTDPSSNSAWRTSTVTVAYTKVTAVPEPSKYAMLLGGLGLIGFIARRRRILG